MMKSESSTIACMHNTSSFQAAHDLSAKVSRWLRPCPFNIPMKALMHNAANEHTAVVTVRLLPALSITEGPAAKRSASLLRGITGPADNSLTKPSRSAGHGIEKVDSTRSRYDDGYAPVTGIVDGHIYPRCREHISLPRPMSNRLEAVLPPLPEH